MNATPTESVSRSPSEEYKADTMSCLLKRHSQTSLATDLECSGELGFVRDGCGGTAEEHGHEDLDPVLWWDETTFYHRLDDENADDR